MLRGEDLLKGLRAKTHIDYPSQKSDMTIYSDTRSVSLTLKYTLGKMNRKNKKEIDSSRFGQIKFLWNPFDNACDWMLFFPVL